MNMTQLPLPVSIGCTPVDQFGIRGLTCWCKTDLCNGDLFPNELLGPKKSAIWPMKRQETLEVHEFEL